MTIGENIDLNTFYMLMLILRLTLAYFFIYLRKTTFTRRHINKICQNSKKHIKSIKFNTMSWNFCNLFYICRTNFRKEGSKFYCKLTKKFQNKKKMLGKFQSATNLKIFNEILNYLLKFKKGSCLICAKSLADYN